jgi:hypothetical protein
VAVYVRNYVDLALPREWAKSCFGLHVQPLWIEGGVMTLTHEFRTGGR